MRVEAVEVGIANQNVPFSPFTEVAERSCASFLFPHVLPTRESGCHLICCGHTQRSRETTTVFQLRSVGCGVYSGGPPTNKDDRSCGNRPAFPGHVSHTCHSFWPYCTRTLSLTKQNKDANTARASRPPRARGHRRRRRRCGHL